MVLYHHVRAAQTAEGQGKEPGQTICKGKATLTANQV